MTNIAPEPNLTCPCCEGQNVRVFHRADDVPVNSVLQLATREEALTFPTSTIALGHCSDCSFVYNTAFDPELLEYSERYNPTQAFSLTFNKWHVALADQLIERYDLHDKRIIEIGCGKGEFLKLLCERGGNDGVGFDPAYEQDERVRSDRARYVADFYGEKYASEQGDFVVCKMTLEHIGSACEFVSTVRRAVGDREETVVVFQVPDVLRILEEMAFWDVYYEHCSYYSVGSLARLFRRCNFKPVYLAREYDDQYLMIEARPAADDESPELDAERDRDHIAELVARFETELPKQLSRWKARIGEFQKQGKKVVIWGSGSKGVAFLTTLGINDGIDYVVDINPNRHGFFMAKTGQEIVGPDFLEEYLPDVVIVMNPVYKHEIVADLKQRGLEPEVLTT